MAVEIYYHANNNTDNVSHKMHSGASTIYDITEFNWTYEGYQFSHWNTKADNTGDSYNPGEPPSFSNTENLYAIWIPLSSIKYWVTDTQLQFLADAIRAEGDTSALLTYPNGFISAINNLSGTHTSSISANWPTEFNDIYWTTSEELESIADAIRAKNGTSETLTYLEDFINSLTVVEDSSEEIYNIYAPISWGSTVDKAEAKAGEIVSVTTPQQSLGKNLSYKIDVCNSATNEIIYSQSELMDSAIWTFSMPACNITILTSTVTSN